MKKIALILTLTLAIVALVPSLAFAATDTETQICNFVKEQDKVLDAQCIVYQNNCVVALKTEKFTNKTEYEKFKIELKKQLAEKFKLENIVVTRSPKAMHSIVEISKMSESEREEAIKKFMEFEFEPKPHHPHIQPK